MDELRYVHFWVLVVSSEKLEAKVTLFLFLFLQQFLILSIKANCEWSIDKVNTWNKVNHIFSSCLSFYPQSILYYCQQQQWVLELRRNFESKIFEVFQVLSCFIFPAATQQIQHFKIPPETISILETLLYWISKESFKRLNFILSTSILWQSHGRWFLIRNILWKLILHKVTIWEIMTN